MEETSKIAVSASGMRTATYAPTNRELRGNTTRTRAPDMGARNITPGAACSMDPSPGMTRGVPQGGTAALPPPFQKPAPHGSPARLWFPCHHSPQPTCATDEVRTRSSCAGVWMRLQKGQPAQLHGHRTPWRARHLRRGNKFKGGPWPAHFRRLLLSLRMRRLCRGPVRLDPNARTRIPAGLRPGQQKAGDKPNHAPFPSCLNSIR